MMEQAILPYPKLSLLITPISDSNLPTRTIQLLDWNNDGFLDIIHNADFNSFELSSDAYISVCTNSGNNTFNCQFDFYWGCNFFNFYAADYDNNGDIDLAFSIEETNQVILNSNFLYANTLLSLTSFALPNGVSDFELKDINNDGSLDVLFSEIGCYNN